MFVFVVKVNLENVVILKVYINIRVFRGYFKLEDIYYLGCLKYGMVRGRVLLRLRKK